MIGATVASERAYGLAEGPAWDAERERILWVDVNRGDVHTGSLRDSFMEPATRVSFEETVGAVVCAQDGRLLVAGARDLYMVDVDGQRSRLASLVDAQKASRLNDGACDPAGRFLVGSMALDDREGQECLYRHTEGNLWIAIWGAGEVRCYTPAGKRLATVDVPAPHTSSVAFVGPARDTLLITTARDELPAAQLAEFPLSGHLFTARLEVAGVPTAPWAGPPR